MGAGAIVPTGIAADASAFEPVTRRDTRLKRDGCSLLVDDSFDGRLLAAFDAITCEFN